MPWIQIINTGTQITAGTGNTIPATSNILIPTTSIASIVSNTTTGAITSITFVSAGANPFGNTTNALTPLTDPDLTVSFLSSPRGSTLVTN